jgi:hypothetical protein
MEILSVLILVIGIGVSIGRRSRQADPFDRPGTADPRHRPRINQMVTDREWADGYVRSIAISGTEPLTDEQVRHAYGDIVNNNDFTNKAKYYLLDGLYQRTANDHPHGMGASVLEEISNESIALDHPEWHGRHGTWNSVRGD